MALIFSVSYDESLLHTRHLLLESAGHSVHSVLGLAEALGSCHDHADLAVIGHSIPGPDKLRIIDCFRHSNPDGRILALTRQGEPRLLQVAHADPSRPEELLRAIQIVLDPGADRRRFSKKAADN